MLVGPDLLVTLTPHAGSRSLARRLSLVASRPAGLSTGTHVGLWAGVGRWPGRWTLGTTRDPVAWHVAHFGHWCRGSGGAERLAPWMGREAARTAREAEREHGTIARAGEVSPGLLDYLWAAYVVGVCTPAAVLPDLEAWPPAASWPRMSEPQSPAQWMAARGVGLASWGYVRQHYPRRVWGMAAADIVDAAPQMHTDALIDCAQLDAGLQEVAEVWGLPLDGAPGPSTSAAPGGALVEPTPEQTERIRRAEWMIYALHPGYLTGDAPAVVWTRPAAP